MPQKSRKSPYASIPILLLTLGMGILMLLSLAKFGTPVSLNQLITRPTNLSEWIYFTWPLEWGDFYIITLAALTGILAIAFVSPAAVINSGAKWKKRCLQLLFCTPLAWVLWQCLASIQSRHLEKSESTLIHFVLCGMCFLMASKLNILDFHASSNKSRSEQSPGNLIWMFWVPVILGLVWTMRTGIEQYFGGLEATRQLLYESPEMLEALPPEYLERIGKNRIFGTYFYPNAFAGAILMILPAVTGFLLQAKKHVRQESGMTRALPLTALILTLTGLACLVWSGSKAGWLIAMAQIGVLWILSPTPGKLKWGALTVGLVIGLSAFFIKYASFFADGATSVGARFGYWSAAVEEWKDHPVWGAGPGTFDLYYAERKEPDWEMTRLAHNDYLQQASDSGLIGAMTYVAWISWILFAAWRRTNLWNRPLILGVWIGALGWALQSLVEFGLYVPGIAWPAFIWLGLLYGEISRQNEIAEATT